MVSAIDLPISSLDEATITNGARDVIEAGLPYRLTIGIVGTAPLLMHAWNIQAVDEKAKAAKGSKAKKTDDIESYAYRDEDGHIGVPGMNFAASIQMAGKFMQDPRSPRKSAFDLCKAGVVPLTTVAPFQPLTVTWDFEHAARVTVQRAGITRIRPAMREGWRLRFDLLITTPEYLSPWQGEPGSVLVRFGWPRRAKAGPGLARQGEGRVLCDRGIRRPTRQGRPGLGLAWLGKAWRGPVVRGMARQGKAANAHDDGQMMQEEHTP